MKISIITVSYNAEKTIEDAIRSVLHQDHPNVEYINIDGGSSDNTLSIIDKYRERIAKVVSEPDKGVYDAMNKGIALATGDVIGILNADDIYADNSVLRQIAGIMADSAIECCYGDLVYVDQGNTEKVIRYWKSRTYKEGLLAKGWVPPHPAFFTRRTAYERYGSFDLDYRIAADFELMARFLSRHKSPSAYIPRILVRMRMGGMTNNNLGNIVRQNREIIRALGKNSIKISPWFPFYKIAERSVQLIRRFSL